MNSDELVSALSLGLLRMMKRVAGVQRIAIADSQYATVRPRPELMRELTLLTTDLANLTELALTGAVESEADRSHRDEPVSEVAPPSAPPPPDIPALLRPPMLGAADAAKRLAVSTSAIYHMAASGRLPCKRLGTATYPMLRFEKEDVQAYVATYGRKRS